MTAYLLLNHVLNFMAPAMVVALVLVTLARLFPGIFGSKRAFIHAAWAQVAINLIVGIAVLVAGLLLFGRDGKMLTYLALVLATAACQWCQLGLWRR